MPRAPKPLEDLDLRVAEVLNELLRASGFSRNLIVTKAGIGNMRGRKIFFAESPAPTIGELSALAHALNTTASALLAEAEARLAASVDTSNVYELSSRGRDIPPIPEGLAARKVPLEKRRGYLARHQWDSVGEESQLPPEEWDE